MHASTEPRLVVADDAPAPSGAADCFAEDFTAEGVGAELPLQAVSPTAAVRTSNHPKRVAPQVGRTQESFMARNLTGLWRAERLMVGVSRRRPYAAHPGAFWGRQ